MAEPVIPLHSLLIPIQGNMLLVPNSVVAEVIAYQTPQSLKKPHPSWFLGNIVWREISLPLVSLEKIMGREIPPIHPSVRIAVMNTVSEKSDMLFYGLLIQGIPHLVQITDSNVEIQKNVLPASPMIGMQVIVNAEVALIPDLDNMETLVYKHYHPL
jgi:chemosensory pili system protein ChpC